MPKSKYAQSNKPLRHKDGRFYKVPSLAYNIPLIGVLCALVGLIVMELGWYGKSIPHAPSEARIEAESPTSTHSFVWYCITVEDKKDCWGTLPATSTKPVVKATEVKKVTSTKTKIKKYSDSQLLVAAKIVEIAKAEKFDNIPYLLALADCESSFKPSNKNAKGNKPSWSVDRGTFMYNSHWKKHVSDSCAYSLTCSTKLAIQDLKAGRQSQWVCDRTIRKENRIPQYVSLARQPS